MRTMTKGLVAVLAAAALAACGGGGGSPGTTTGGSTGGSTTGGTTGGTTTTPVASAAVAVSLANAAGTAVNNIDSRGGYQARATVTDASGAPVANTLVTFSLSDTAIATLSPATALTNASGVAQTTIAPTSLSSLGATTLSAAASVGGTSITGKKDLSVSASNLALSALGVGQTSLASGGNTSLSVTALVNGAAAGSTPVNVNFTASCGRINSQTGVVSVTTNGSGIAPATYTAVQADGSLCSGSVTLSASAAGVATPATATVTVAAPTANAITFVSATPSQIYVQGSGALEQSLAKFKVLAGNAPLQNEAVTFSIVTNPGGVGLGSSGSTTPVAGTTDANGEAQVSIFSGSIPGPVKVRAQLVSNAAVFVETQNLTVASGPPSQRYMDLSVQTFNIEGADRSGTSTVLTVRLADRQGNAVEDGTVVNFTAEGGQVASSCATAKVSGISQCSVTFQSQNPRPANGRVSVLAYANGTKDYVDVNANNLYDAGTDTLLNIGDAYRDDNESDAFEAGEFVIPRGGSGTCVGAGDGFPARADTCDTALATTVRQQAVILFSSSGARIKHPTTNAWDSASVSTGAITFRLTSDYSQLLPMPAGSTVAATTKDNTPGNALGCAINTVTPSTVPNVAPGTSAAADASTAHSVNLTNCAAGDEVYVTVTSPSGLVTPFSFVLP